MIIDLWLEVIGFQIPFFSIRVLDVIDIYEAQMVQLRDDIK